MNTNFIVFDSTQPGIEPESTVSVGHTLSIRLLVSIGRRATTVSCRGGKLGPKNKIFCLKNVSIEQRTKQTVATHAYHRRGLSSTARNQGGLEAKPPTSGQFFSIENWTFQTIRIKFRTFSEPFEITKLLRLRSYLENQIAQPLPFKTPPPPPPFTQQSNPRHVQ